MSAPSDRPSQPPPTDEAARYSRVKALFLEALGHPTGSRTRFLEAACGPDPGLFAEVAELLTLHGDATMFAASPSAPGQPAPDLDLPEQLPGFKVLDVLGWGGMGVVYLAEQLSANRKVVLKILRPGIMAPSLRARFVREGELLQRLDHPGIAKVHEMGAFDTPSGPRPFLAMEWREGRTLRESMRAGAGDRRGRVELLAQLCDALEYAHGEGVIHRDIKPENVLVTPEGQPVLLDFGIARVTTEATVGQTLVTRPGQLLGTLEYMSPEQAQASAEPVDARTDVYSLGVVGYELLTGRLPYEVPRDSLHRAVLAVVTAEPVPASALVRELRGGLDRVLAQCLSKKPADRYASAAALAADLRRHLAGQRVTARPLRVSGAAARRRNGILLVASALGALVLAVFFAWRAGGAHRVATPEETRAALQHLYLQVEECDQLMNERVRNRETIQQALVGLGRARSMLLDLPPLRYAPDLNRFLSWRSGEAHYLLGGMNYDVRELKLALNSWQEATTFRWDPGALSGMDTTVPFFRSAAGLGRHHAIAATAMAMMAIAQYEEPAANCLAAVNNMQAASEAIADSADYVIAFHAGPDERSSNLRILLNDFGSACVRCGVLMDSLPLIQEGLRHYKEASELIVGERLRDPYGSFLHGYGTGWLRWSELTGSREVLDSSRVWLGRALEYRTESQDPDEFASTKREIARLHLQEARLAPLAATRQAELDAALEAVTTAERAAGAGADSVGRALLQVLEAEVRIDRGRGMAEPPRGNAAARGARAALPSPQVELGAADSLLDRATLVLSEQRFLQQFATVEFQRGRLDATRWTLGRQSADRDEADAHFTRALELTPFEGNPHLNRQIQRELARLRAAGASSRLVP